jgi:phage shock protein PspC (stress-responsive transcriptional regulator)
MFEFTKENRNIIGVIMGISYTLYFNLRIGQYPLIETLVYSLPFLAASALIGFGISKVRKDNNFGIYFAVISLIFVVSKI